MTDIVDPKPEGRAQKWTMAIAYVAFLIVIVVMLWYFQLRQARAHEKYLRPNGSLDDVLP